MPREPYRSYGIDLATFFSRGSPREQEDLISLSDRVYGWDSDYSILGRTAREAVLAHPGTFSWAVFQDFVKELWKPLFAGRKAAATEAAATSAPATPAPPPTVVVNGTELPAPTEGEPIPSENQSAQISTPDHSIREVWTSATEHHVVFDDPAKRARWEANDRWVAELYAAFPDRWWSPWLGLQMDRSSKLYPPPLLWLLAGVVGVGLRRPWRWWATVAPVAGALLMLLATVSGSLGRTGLRRTRRARLRAVCLRGTPRRPDETGCRPDECRQHAEQQYVPEQQVTRLEGATLVHVVAVEIREPDLRRDEGDRE